MLLIVTPLKEWRRRILIFRFVDATEADVFEAMQAVNSDFASRGERHKVNITLAPITMDQLDDWIDNNIDPTVLERMLGRIRYIVTVLSRDS